MRKNNRKEIVPPSDEVIVGLLNGLLANLEGEHDRTSEMAFPLLPEDFPPDLDFHRKVYEVILDCSSRDIPPTRHNILRGLAVLFHTA